MKTAGNLVVLGSINADHILNLELFPAPGETVTGNQALHVRDHLERRRDLAQVLCHGLLLQKKL